MSSEYDPIALLAKAQAWRSAAKTAPAQWYDFYVGIAEHYEADVRRSMEVPIVTDRIAAGTTGAATAMPDDAAMQCTVTDTQPAIALDSQHHSR
jgi:hypothetical protein